MNFKFTKNIILIMCNNIHKDCAYMSIFITFI